MNDQLFVPFEAKWRVLGPFPETGKVTREIPELEGGRLPAEWERLRQREVFSKGGHINFAQVYDEKTPRWVSAFAETELDGCEETIYLVIAADWTSLWWLNGQLIFNQRTGDGIPPSRLYANELYLRLQPGPNYLLVRSGSGSNGWSLQMKRATRRTWHPSPLRVTTPAVSRASRDYSATGLRVENRPHADVPDLSWFEREAGFAQGGVQARWISLVDNQPRGSGAPLFSSSSLIPTRTRTAGADERLAFWMRRLREEKFAVISWWPFCSSFESVAVRDDWRAVPLEKERPCRYPASACLNTGYLPALADTLVEAVDRYDLDGFWFDWALLTGMNLCVCQACARRFAEEENRFLPESVDWDDENFLRYIDWRFRLMTRSIAQLVSSVRRHHPGVSFAFNHQNRGGDGWRSGWPLAPTGLDVIGGTEADPTDGGSSFFAKVQRAYGNRQSEVWMGLHNLARTLNGNSSIYAHHALSCLTAGAMPSFGNDDALDNCRDGLTLLSSLINGRRPWIEAETVPFIGLHLGHQTCTYAYGRNGGFDPAWRSVRGWESLLTENQMLSDILFDAHLTSEVLMRYSILIFPLSVALSDRQLQAVSQYVENGGTAVLGPWFGCLDEWGRSRRGVWPVGGEQLPCWEASAGPAIERGVEITQQGAGKFIRTRGCLGTLFEATLELPTDELEVIQSAGGRGPVTVEPRQDVACGLFRRPGELILHLYQRPRRSLAGKVFPNPLLHPPAARTVQVCVEGYPIREVSSAIENEGWRIEKIKCQEKRAEFVIEDMTWGSVVRLLW